jgi:transcriptional regulator with XRE-family HTH domain
MTALFAETLKRLRVERGFSQKSLADRICVTRSTVARWENGSRLPDVAMISRLAKYLNVDVNTLLSATAERDEAPNIIMVDDRKIILRGGLPVLEKTFPNATVAGFTVPSEAVEYAKRNRVSLAFLDIELGKATGFDLCHTLLEIYPRTNVIYLTAYIEYAYDAWKTGASGFMLKPITPESIQEQLRHLRYPFLSGGMCQ